MKANDAVLDIFLMDEAARCEAGLRRGARRARQKSGGFSPCTRS